MLRTGKKSLDVQASVFMLRLLNRLLLVENYLWRKDAFNSSLSILAHALYSAVCLSMEHAELRIYA